MVDQSSEGASARAPRGPDGGEPRSEAGGGFGASLGVHVAWAAVLVALVHGSGLHHGFHLDDAHSITDNVWIRSFAHAARWLTDVSTFSPLAENRSYRPVLLVSYALAHALGGGAPWAYRIFSWLFHALAAAAVGRLAVRWLDGARSPDRRVVALGLVANALFCVHPLLSEPIAYVSGRSSSMAAAGMLWAVLLYVEGRERARPWLLGASSVVLLLALGTKIIAVTVPALLLGYELLLGPDRRRLRTVPLRAWALRLGPPAALTVGFTALHEALVGPAGRGARGDVDAWTYFLTQGRVWLHYQGLFVWPEDLCADLVVPWSRAPWEGPTARAFLVALGLVAAGWAVRRTLPLVSFGIAWFYVTLAPTNSVVPLAEPASEHRVYVAIPGLVLALAALAHRALARGPRGSGRIALGGAIVLLVALGARTIDRVEVWRDEASLWSDTLRCAPDNARAHLNHGRALHARGDRAGARAAYERCGELAPRYAYCALNLAALELQEGRVEAADVAVARAERSAPANVYVRLWRGEVELARGRWDAAGASFAGTLAIAPGHLAARRGLARARFEIGRFEEGRALYEGLEAEGALDAAGAEALGYLADLRGDTARAELYYRAALAGGGGSTRARFNLGSLLHRAGRLDEAIAAYQVLSATPEPSAEVLHNLVLALAAKGDVAGARAVKDRLAALHPGWARLGELP